MKKIQVEGTEYVLLGTAHISKESAAQVKAEIASGDYDAIAVELCENRHNNMRNPDQFSNTDLWQVIRQGKSGMMLANLALGAYQKRLAEGFDIEPGADMKAAIEGAGAASLNLFLIDRDIGITLKRVYRSLSLWNALEMFAGMLNSVLSREKISEEAINQIKQGDMLESALTEFADKSPDLYAPLIQERDRYMATRLQQLAETDSPRRVLVVVGAGHVAGMSRYLAEHTDNAPGVLQELTEVKRGFGFLKIIPWLVVGLILLGFGIGFSRSPELGLKMMTDWVLLNGGLSGIGALLAGAHPLTLLTAIVAAPITSLNPVLGAGMVCGLVEASLRKPRVADFVNLRSDAASFNGWRKNQVTRTLLVFALTTLGSAIGTYLGGAMILGRLASN
ncbi:MAG: TraB/GumN family protein [Gammaproteobacteria bacterium]